MTLTKLFEAPSRRLQRLIAMPAMRQLMRYIFAGLCVTQFAAAIYSALVLFARFPPQASNVMSTICGVSAGYLVHSRWSFAGGASGRESWQAGRFLIASLFAFFVNATWVWLFVSILQLPPTTPVPLMMFATPWISFLLNRYWVFRAH